RIAKDAQIPLSKKELDSFLKNPEKFSGMAKTQTEDFIKDKVAPVLEKYKNQIEHSISNIEV
ncbi:MAG: adenylosuccinate lyase, partial [Candidatus Aenigmarchaeota archaeon]|nr:adenylosuccinate lyase [Candidatus Aenigmarchaeota archaeon]